MNVTHVLDAPTRTLNSTVVEDGETLASISVTWKTDAEMAANVEKAKGMAENIARSPEVMDHSSKNKVHRHQLGKFVISFGVFRGQYDNGAIHIARYKLTKRGLERSASRRATFGFGGRHRAYAMTIEKKE